MTKPDPGAGLDRLAALLTPGLWERVDGTNRAAVVGWGTTLNVAHLVRAVRTLHAEGQCYAALPLLRSVMEYALGTIWLADMGESAVDVLNRKLQGSHKKLLADLADTDLAAFPAEAVRSFQGVLDAELPSSPDQQLAAFKHLLQAYGLDQMVPVYNVLSGISHLSLEGAGAFFKYTADGAIALSQQPGKGEAAWCEEISLGMQFDTMLAYNKLLSGEPWTPDLAAIAEDHGMPAVLATRVPRP